MRHILTLQRLGSRRYLHGSIPRLCAEPSEFEFEEIHPIRKWPLDLRGEEIRTSKARRLGINTSTQKLNLVAKLVRGLTISEAQRQLIACKKKTAPIVSRTIDAAVTNAKAFNLREDRLIVNEAYVGKGKYLKRIRPWHGKGRYGIEHKKYAHLTIFLRELDEELWEAKTMTKYAHIRRSTKDQDDMNHPIHKSDKVSFVSDLDTTLKDITGQVQGLKLLVEEERQKLSEPVQAKQ